MRRALPCCLALGFAGLALGFAGLALGAPSPLEGGETLLWVPRLTHAWTLDVGAESRVVPLGEASEAFAPERHLRLHVGYLRYLDGHGRLSLGGYVGGGLSVGTLQQPAPAPSGRFDVGLLVRTRQISPDFLHLPIGIFLEGGGQVLGDRLGPTGPVPDGDRLAWRAAAGVEMGFGLLWYQDPFWFGEILFRLGIETLHAGGRHFPAWFAGVRLNLERAGRAGAAADDWPEPPKPPAFDPFADPQDPTRRP